MDTKSDELVARRFLELEMGFAHTAYPCANIRPIATLARSDKLRIVLRSNTDSRKKRPVGSRFKTPQTFTQNGAGDGI